MEEHLAELLKLPTEERVRLAQLLLESVQSDVPADPTIRRRAVHEFGVEIVYVTHVPTLIVIALFHLKRAAFLDSPARPAK